MIEWLEKSPQKGDQIKVNRGFYYHTAIYISDIEVIEFGSGLNQNIDPELVRVQQTTLKEFLQNEKLLVRVYSKDEKKRLNKPKVIIRKARSAIGLGNYDFLKNNCEHFTNDCVFNERFSPQIAAISAGLKAKLQDK